jgi:ribosomal protein L37E
MTKLKHPNFYGKDGTPFLVRCPECCRENYAFSVASGQCAWCSYQAERLEDETTDK